MGIRREEQVGILKCDGLTAAFWWEVGFVLCCTIEELVHAFAAIYMTTWRRHEVPFFVFVSTRNTLLHESVRAWNLVFRICFMIIDSVKDVLSFGSIKHGGCGGI